MERKIKVVPIEPNHEDWYEANDSDELDAGQDDIEIDHRQRYAKFIDDEAGSSGDDIDYPSGDGPEDMDQGSGEEDSDECDESDGEYEIHPCDHCGADGEAEFNGYVFCEGCYARLRSNNDTTGGRRLPGEIVTTTSTVGKSSTRTSRILTKLQAKQQMKKT